jgi:hypothetical protein
MNNKPATIKPPCSCGAISICKGLCQKCYSKTRYKRRRKKVVKVGTKAEIKALSKWQNRKIEEIEEETDEEYFARVYDEELKKEIEYYLKTGKLFK